MKLDPSFVLGPEESCSHGFDCTSYYTVMKGEEGGERGKKKEECGKVKSGR